MNETLFQLEVRPNIPDRLTGLEQLANDLLYSWDRDVRGLFYRLDDQLWEDCNHNPKVFLRRIAQDKLDEAVEDHMFMEEYSRVMSSYRTYHDKGISTEIIDYLDSEQDLIAYFCAEFGLHESFPIYSGGLGILAGDHCKAASDLGIPFVGVGLLYRQGYFTQYIDGNGNQLAQYNPTNFDELVIQPAHDPEGNDCCVEVELDGRTVKLKVWVARAGHIRLYLLDSDLEENATEDRSITFQLYGGDSTTRIQQEIVLGIGGVRALRALGIQPSAWHINEGHAAFQIPERCREHIQAGMDFFSAFELVSAGTVFTTHTPVPAGHDIFTAEQMNQYFKQYIKSLGIDLQSFMRLGESPNNHGSFNMTALAMRGSRYQNGVSRIHGGVASGMEGYVWPQVPHNENPISYVTNGVHVQTFLAREWVNLFDMRFREWRSELNRVEYWNRIDEIPDHRYWSLRQELKAQMLEDVNKRIRRRFRRAGFSEAQLKRLTSYTSEPEQNVLVLGFARRFATYKRATLLFSDPQRLARLLNNPKRPVILVFAGKAHPRDNPGQELIRTIHEFSLRPEFIGKIILLEGYDMAMARKLVTGVDVWLNTPEYPLEASGTSGQKAAINGVINLSVLDGWWGEGYNGENGWAIHPHARHVDADLRNQEEAADLLDILENEIIPLYYEHGTQGYSPEWVKLSKASMKTCLPRFNAQRMVVDYVRDFYAPARSHYQRLAANDSEPARRLATWKEKIRQSWKEISIRRIDEASSQIHTGESLPVVIHASLNGLNAEDVIVECVVGSRDDNGKLVPAERYQFTHTGMQGNEHVFELQLKPGNPGLNYYKLRVYPWHELLGHPFEMGYMLWI